MLLEDILIDGSSELSVMWR